MLRKQLEIGREEISTQLPTWIIRWNKVLESCLAAMEGEYDETQMNDAQILWAEFLNHRLPSPPIMRKEEGWAAAIEYIVAKMHGISITQAAVARKYCVSPSTVSHHIREISQVCILIHGDVNSAFCRNEWKSDIKSAMIPCSIR